MCSPALTSEKKINLTLTGIALGQVQQAMGRQNAYNESRSGWLRIEIEIQLILDL